ncbi:MAG: hypothetical protein ACOYA8_04395 [Clostridium sp.]|jgi:hypothetical protein
MRMKTVLRASVLGAALAGMFSMTAYAQGSWKNNEKGYWWQEEDGSYPVSCWKWLDGNCDGIAESYYFDANGYMAANTVVDGYTVNTDGAWTVDGVVQTKQAETQNASSALLTPGTYQYYKTNIYQADNGVLRLDGSVFDGSMESYSKTFNERSYLGLHADYTERVTVKDVTDTSFVVDEEFWATKFVKSGDRWYPEEYPNGYYYYVIENSDTITYYNTYTYRWNFDTEDMTEYPYLEVCTYKRLP